MTSIDRAARDLQIAAFLKSAGWSAADAALIRATDELHADQFVTDATWAELSRHFSEKQRMDVVFTAGQYTQVSMFLNSFGVQGNPVWYVSMPLICHPPSNSGAHASLE